MLTRQPPLRGTLFMAGFIIAAFALTLFVWLKFGGSTPLAPKGYRVHVQFLQAQNLQPNADVRISGVKVGRVAKVTPSTKRTDAVLEIDARYVPLHEDARVITRVKTLLGETFVAITPGSRNARPIPDGGTISNANIAPTQQLDEVLGAFDARTRSTLRRYLTQTAESLDGRGEDFNATLGYLGPTAEELDQLLTTLDHQRGDLSRFVNRTGRVFDALSRNPEALRTLVRSGNRVLGTTDEVKDSLRRTIDALVPLQRELRAGAGSGVAVARAARPSLRTLKPVAGRSKAAFDGAERLGDELTRLFKALPPSVNASLKGLPPATRMIEASRPLTGRLLKATRQLLPAVMLASAYRNDLVGGLANLASTLQGTYKDSSGVSRHYLRSLLTINNESSAKATERIATNRHNPYGRPGWLLDLGKGGLRTADCRNISSTAVAPALGTGSPPCSEQEPWTFRGRTSYFPSMTQAP